MKYLVRLYTICLFIQYFLWFFLSGLLAQKVRPKVGQKSFCPDRKAAKRKKTARFLCGLNFLIVPKVFCPRLLAGGCSGVCDPINNLRTPSG